VKTGGEKGRCGGSSKGQKGRGEENSNSKSEKDGKAEDSEKLGRKTQGGDNWVEGGKGDGRDHKKGRPSDGMIPYVWVWRRGAVDGRKLRKKKGRNKTVRLNAQVRPGSPCSLM